MLDPFFADYFKLYRRWTQGVTRMVWAGPWNLLNLQCRAGMSLMDTLLSAAAAKKTTAEPAEVPPAGGVAEEARQRLRQGYAPPREIYDVRHRNRVDWLTLPDWARPPDPELFEGCSHEG
jgi:hypothetical protein